MIEFLNKLDTSLFLILNGLHCSFLDVVMYWLSDKYFWLPMYLGIAFFIVRKYKMQGVIILLLVGVVITLCDQTASTLIKNTVMRLRPSHEPALSGLVHLSKAGAGGLYGFVSSHAANAFGLAFFLSFVLNNQFKYLKYWLFIWAFMVSYSRIYNGVHYPGDVIVAAGIGFLIAKFIAKLYDIIIEKLNRKVA